MTNQRSNYDFAETSWISPITFVDGEGNRLELKSWRRRCECMAAISVKNVGDERPKWRQILSLLDKYWPDDVKDKSLYSDTCAKACVLVLF